MIPIFIIWYFHNNMKNEKCFYSPNCIHVEKMKWTKKNDDSELAKFMQKRSIPMVLTDSVVKREWKAFKKFTPQYLQKQIKQLKNVFKHTKRVFGPYYDPSRIMNNLKTVNRDKNSYKVIYFKCY